MSVATPDRVWPFGRLAVRVTSKVPGPAAFGIATGTFTRVVLFAAGVSVAGLGATVTRRSFVAAFRANVVPAGSVPLRLALKGTVAVCPGLAVTLPGAIARSLVATERLVPVVTSLGESMQMLEPPKPPPLRSNGSSPHDTKRAGLLPATRPPTTGLMRKGPAKGVPPTAGGSPNSTLNAASWAGVFSAPSSWVYGAEMYPAHSKPGGGGTPSVSERVYDALRAKESVSERTDPAPAANVAGVDVPTGTRKAISTW